MIKILTQLQSDSRKSYQEIARYCLTSVPTIKSRVDRLLDLGIIREFTLDIVNSKLDIAEAILIINAKLLAVNIIAEELLKLEEIKELYIPSVSEAAIVSRSAGDMQHILAIQDRINLADVNDIRVIPVKNPFRKDATIPLASSSITLNCRS